MNFTPLLILFFVFTTALYSISRYVSLYGLFVNKKANDVLRDWNWKPKVTVMMSCFNESEEVYKCIKGIMACDYPHDKLQVIAYDDCSKDDSFAWLQKAAAEYPDNVIVRRNEKNMGKDKTMLAIAQVSDCEILIATDSDTVFDVNAIKELVSCYADPKIGAVGGQIRIKNPNDSLCSQMQALQYVKNFYLYKPFENANKTSRCLGGPIVSFRREIYMDMIPRIQERNFLGSKIAYAEDTFITYMVVFGGHKTFVNLDAKCWAGTPTTWGGYLNQQLRWRRGTLQMTLKLLGNLRKCIAAGGTLAVFMNMLQTLSICYLAVMGVYTFSLGVFLPFIITYVVMGSLLFSLAGPIYNATVGRTDPIGPLKNPIIAGILFIIWVPVNLFLLTPFALLTLDDGGWVTRQETTDTGAPL